MDLDLITNSLEIKISVNLLNEGKISWIVFGYTNDKIINVNETGDEHYERMFEEFDSNKIMYGFLSIVDETTKLKKNVFIYWQGDAASQTMKTISVQHSNIIRDLLKPVHVVHNARSVQDLDMQDIIKKVASSLGSNYSCNAEEKAVYEHQASVQSEGNTAASLRQKRMMELSSLASLPKEPVPDYRIGSRYEKIDPSNEIKSLRNSISDSVPGSISKPAAARYGKVDSSSSSTSSPLHSRVKSIYNIINPENELNSSNTNQKMSIENKMVIKGQNNTAERVKEERLEELSSIFQNKKNSFDEDCNYNVQSSYKKINPQEEIVKLRRESLVPGNDDEFSVASSSYKRIDPNEEIQQFRSSISRNVDEYDAPRTNYKKINPAEEIRRLRSQSLITSHESLHPLENETLSAESSSRFKNTKITSDEDSDYNMQCSYKKINPQEEIVKLRRESLAHENDDVFSVASSSYKRIDPNIEIQQSRSSCSQNVEECEALGTNYKKINPVEEIRRLRSQGSITTYESSHSSENEPRSTGTNYKRINPAEEIKLLQSMNTVKDTGPTKSHFDKINAMEEINTARRLSLEISKNDSNSLNNSCPTTTPVIKKPIEILSARKSFQDVHKKSDNYNSISKNRLSNQAALEEKEESINDVPSTFRNDFDSNVENQEKNLDEISSNQLMTVRALYDFTASSDSEISFSEGDIVYAVTKTDSEWWEGEIVSGKRGVFPFNYVEKI